MNIFIQVLENMKAILIGAGADMNNGKSKKRSFSIFNHIWVCQQTLTQF